MKKNDSQMKSNLATFHTQQPRILTAQEIQGMINHFNTELDVKWKTAVNVISIDMTILPLFKAQSDIVGDNRPPEQHFLYYFIFVYILQG